MSDGVMSFVETVSIRSPSDARFAEEAWAWLAEFCRNGPLPPDELRAALLGLDVDDGTRSRFERWCHGRHEHGLVAPSRFSDDAGISVEPGRWWDRYIVPYFSAGPHRLDGLLAS